VKALELAKNVSDDDQAEISEIGIKGYLKRQIARFFNIEP
jgi:hypothetical protein